MTPRLLSPPIRRSKTTAATIGRRWTCWKVVRWVEGFFFFWESLPGLRPAKGMSFKAFEPSWDKNWVFFFTWWRLSWSEPVLGCLGQFYGNISFTLHWCTIECSCKYQTSRSGAVYLWGLQLAQADPIPYSPWEVSKKVEKQRLGAGQVCEFHANLRPQGAAYFGHVQ